MGRRRLSRHLRRTGTQIGRVAAESRRTAAAGRPDGAHRSATRRIPQRHAPGAYAAGPGAAGMKRRELLEGGTLVLLLGTQQIARGASIVAVRVWPAPEYSRVTIESDRQLSSSQIVMANPPRLTVDITGLDLNPELRELVGKVKSDDPFIEDIRVGQHSPGVVRLVVDLKQVSVPQVFTLSPVAAYQHRLVFDFYPLKTVDPLEALIAERLRDQPVPQSTLASDPLGELIAEKLQRARPADAS